MDPQPNVTGRLNPSTPLADKSIGVLLGCMCGDVLGTPTEGQSRQMILSFCKQKGIDKFRDFVAGAHMGLYHLPPRYGMYTDDTNSTLALVTSLVTGKRLGPILTAHMYGRFWMQEPRRGYPNSAQAVMANILQGGSITDTGTLCFPDGSFANGGLMRISPIGVAFRNATLDQLHEATKWAIISSHVHPEAVDAAFVQAHGIRTLLPLKSVDEMTPTQFIGELLRVSRNENVKERIQLVLHFLEDPTPPPVSVILHSLGSGFQIKAIEALGCALWAFVSNWDAPEECIIDAVGYGGDTDTVAAIAGVLAGALHGTDWIPTRWFDNLENGDYGRDYAIDMAIRLADLDLTQVAHETPDERTQIEAESLKTPPVLIPN